MTKLTYTNIFEAITDDAAEAAELEFRADVMLVLREFFKKKNWTQAQIGEELGIAQPHVSDLMRGKVDKFSSDKLIRFLAIAGFGIKPTFISHTRGKQLALKCEVRSLTAA